jgi:hypothetical protein
MAEADATRRVNDRALRQRGREMNPRMLSPVERTRVIEMNNGHVPRNWPVYEQFADAREGQSTVRNESETNPVWDAEYGVEEVMECLDREEDEDKMKGEDGEE